MLRNLTEILFVFFCFCIFTFGVYGQSKWFKIYGDPYPAPDQTFSVLITKDNNILTIEERNFWNSRTVLTKFDLDGNIIWQRDIATGYAYTAVEDSLGNLYVPINRGYPSLYKLDPQGNILWSREYNHPLILDWLACKITTDYRHLILTARNTSFDSKINLTKIDTSGKLIWSKDLYANDTLRDYFSGFRGLQLTQDGYYIPASRGIGNGRNPLIIKTDTSGNILWDINTFAVSYGGFASIAQISNNSFITDGSYCINGGGCGLYCVKFNSGGAKLWERSYIQDSVYTSGSIIKTLNNRIVITGGAGDGFAPLVIFDTIGNIINNIRHYVNPNAYAGYFSVKNTPDNGLIFAGRYSEQLDEGLDCFIVKTDSNANTVVLGINHGIEIATEFYMTSYPNPFNPMTTLIFNTPKKTELKFTIHNVLGQEVYIIPITNYNAGTHKINIDFEKLNLTSGIYFVNATGNTINKSIKILYVK